MGMIAKVGAAIQHLFGKGSEAAAQKSGVIGRKRKFTASTLLQTFVFWVSEKPRGVG